MKYGWVVLGLLLAAGGATAAEAQAGRERVSVFARGGGMSALTDLNESGTQKLATGFGIGGGVSVELHKYVAVRADFNYAENDVEVNGNDTGQGLNRYFYGAAVQLQLPTASGVMPYVFAGGGAVTIEPDGASNRTRGQGTFGGGVRYDLKESRVGLFAEGVLHAYKPEVEVGGSTITKTQWDLAWTGGVSIRLF